MKIANRNIGPDYPPYVIAEISGNHGGSVKTACDLVIAAKESGASCVKIQCYTADSICAQSVYRIEGGLWDGQDLYELYRKAETPPNMAKEIILFAREHKITCFSSVFDFENLDFLVKLGVPAIKIASFELVDTPLISKAASYGLPMIISCGMGTHEEITHAVNAVKRGRENRKLYDLALLHCISEYPAVPEDANLGVMGPLSGIGGESHIVGFSDHTLGIGTACAAVAFGAAIIEKHFILDRSLDAPDAAFSMEPAEFRLLTEACHDAWAATSRHFPAENALSRQSQTDLRGQWQASSGNHLYRNSLYVVRSLSCGDPFSPSNVRILRPANGLPPSLYGSVLAGVATRDLPAGTPLSREMVSTLS